MTRLEKVFNQKETKNKVLVTYTVAGDPNLGSSKKILNDLIASGADILEIGVPFSDPMSEGPVIQKAHERALKKNIQFNLSLEGFGSHDYIFQVRFRLKFLFCARVQKYTFS